jgi:HPt (histidine-containing phosphotransfer) domain-containing protein/DNA-binding response OmpR family regulator
MGADHTGEPSASHADTAARGLRVLVVDGSEEGRRTLGLLLRSLGMEPNLMSHAQAASDELRRAFREGQPYGLLLFDSSLRGSVAFRARRAQDDPLLSITPRIELAAGARPEAEGAERGPLLQRPVTRGSLLAALEQALGSGVSAPPRPAVPRPAGAPAPRVLLMEPDPVSALVTSRLVELAGGEPVAVSSLEQALASVHGVDLALLDATRSDVSMRLERLRRARPGLRILGLIGAGQAQPEDGFEACLEAPLDAEALRLRLGQARGDASAAPVPPAAPPYDRGQLAARLGDDEEAAERVLVRFADQAGARLRELAEAVGSGDAQAIRMQLHRLKGGLSWIGAERAAGVAAAMEELSEAGEVQRAVALLETLKQETERVVAAIRGSAGDAPA